MIRCGIGYDVHRLVEGRKLILGGVEIAHSHGLAGHSDADVLSHAIADALLGAIGGRHRSTFPKHRRAFRDMSSLKFCARTKLLADKGACDQCRCNRYRRGAETCAAHSGDAKENRASDQPPSPMSA
jgi:2-C-methyl-D-erythritol 2,4-cyclodiphosphate synthase